VELQAGTDAPSTREQLPSQSVLPWLPIDQGGHDIAATRQRSAAVLAVSVAA